MQFDFKGLRIQHEQQLIDIVRELNSDIEFSNLSKKDNEKEPLLDLEYVLRRYKSIKYRNDKKDFREEHDCAYCLYFEKKTCKAVYRCPIDEKDKRKFTRTPEQTPCPKDEEGNCPYGNDVGTCFGFCWKDILQEFNENKRNKQEERNDELFKN